MRRARIAGAIDTVAKARDLAPRRQGLIDIGRSALGLVDFQEHLHHFVDGSTVQRAFDGAEAGIKRNRSTTTEGIPRRAARSALKARSWSGDGSSPFHKR